MFADLSTLWAVDEAPRYTLGFLGCAVWSGSSIGATLSMRSVRLRVQASARTTGSRAWANKWLAGSAPGAAGSGSALSASSPASLAVAGSEDQSDGSLAGGATDGGSRGALQRGVE